MELRGRKKKAPGELRLRIYQYLKDRPDQEVSAIDIAGGLSTGGSKIGTPDVTNALRGPGLTEYVSARSVGGILYFRLKNHGEN